MTSAFERGDLDEAARQGALAGPVVVERALRAPARTTRLAAIVSAPGVEDRAELLPALARAAASADRRDAIPAAGAARAIARGLAAHELADDLAAEELDAWRADFEALARAPERFVEVRVAALDTASALAHATDARALGFALEPLLADRDPDVRVAALALVPQPAPSGLRAALVATVIGDSDARVALGAAQALCADLAFDDPAPIVAALGTRGLDRVRSLVAGERTAAARDASRCLPRSR